MARKTTMNDDPGLRTITAVLANTSLRYSSTLRAVLEFLLSAHVQGSTASARDIEQMVLGESSREPHLHSFHDRGLGSNRVRSAIGRLGRLLDEYFEHDPVGRTLPCRIGITSTRKGYGLVFKPIPQPQASPQTLMRVFLCHSSGDKKRVRELHQLLARDGFAPWLDEQDLLPGQDWNTEIKKAVRLSEIVLVCLSKSSITKQGFVQKEIKFALDVADEKPDGLLYIIPVRIEECTVPERLSQWQWVDLFSENGYSRLLQSLYLRSRAEL
jgi:hypothetical protein